MVGAVRFELTTSCTRNKRASQATLRPEPGDTLRVRSRVGNAFFCDARIPARRYSAAGLGATRSGVVPTFDKSRPSSVLIMSSTAW